MAGLFGTPSSGYTLHDLPVQAAGPIQTSGSVVKVISIEEVSPQDPLTDPPVSVVDQVVPPQNISPRMFSRLSLSHRLPLAPPFPLPLPITRGELLFRTPSAKKTTSSRGECLMSALQRISNVPRMTHSCVLCAEEAWGEGERR